MAGPSPRQVELLLAKDESLLPGDIGVLQARLSGLSSKRLAIAEIAGRDSIAAVVAAAREGRIDAAVPTAVYTGTEFGDWSALFETVDRLRTRLQEYDVEVVGDLELIGSPKLWGALNGRYMARLIREFGFCTPCVGCHLYVHLVRVPFAWALGAGTIVAGERESHDGRIKVNQTAAALDAYVRVIESAGLKLALPIRRTERGGEVEALIGDDWAEGTRQLGCVFSKNYVTADGAVSFDEEGFGQFLDRFIVPAGKAVLDAWRRDEAGDYERIIADAADLRELRR